jgi:serine/threonine-protein kinase
VVILGEMRACRECQQRYGTETFFCPFDGSKLEVMDGPQVVDRLVGATIEGRYQVVRRIGEGGMGTVYEVRHSKLGRSFAMKVLRGDVARQQNVATRFINEAKAAASIRHPHVVSITDFGYLVDATPFFVMELLVGQTLSQLIKKSGPLELARAHAIVSQIVGALEAAHDAGVVHRDLKPENVFLVRPLPGTPSDIEDDVKIVDFGAAKVLGTSRITKTGIVFGTPHYMSPEQASGQPVDHRADVYALGVIMYEMLTGRVPFEADTYMGVLSQHMFVVPRTPSEVQPERFTELRSIEGIALRALEKRPDDRYASMRELRSDLDAVARDHTAGVTSRPARWSRSSVEGVALAESGPSSTLPQATRPADRPPLAVRTAAVLGVLFGLVVLGLTSLFKGLSAPGRPAAPAASLPSSVGPPVDRMLPPWAPASSPPPAREPTAESVMGKEQFESGERADIGERTIRSRAPVPPAERAVRPADSGETTPPKRPTHALGADKPALRPSALEGELADPWAK